MEQQLSWKSLLNGIILSLTVPLFSECTGMFEEPASLESHGGIYFLMQVDTETAIRQYEEKSLQELRVLFRENELRYKGMEHILDGEGGIILTFTTVAERESVKTRVAKQYDDFVVTEQDNGDDYRLHLLFNEAALKKRRQQTLAHNFTILNHRIKELGFSNAVIEPQGDDRIMVKVPGVQETAHVKEVLSATMTLEFRWVADNSDEGRLYQRRDEAPVRLKHRVIITSDQITEASATTGKYSDYPTIMAHLTDEGAQTMLHATQKNIGQPMAVVLVKYQAETRIVDGKPVTTHHKTEEVINVAVVMEAFGKDFQMTGLSENEAKNLALLLRAGTLKAPMAIIEEGIVAPRVKSTAD